MQGTEGSCKRSNGAAVNMKEGEDSHPEALLSLCLMMLTDIIEFYKCLKSLSGARQDGLSILEFAHLLGFSHSTISRVYTQWTEKKRAAVLSGCLMPGVRAEPGCCFKLKGRQR